MAVPKRKHSKSRKRIKKACWKIIAPNLRPCPACSFLSRSHYACPQCGQYKGKQVINIKPKKTETKG